MIRKWWARFRCLWLGWHTPVYREYPRYEEPYSVVIIGECTQCGMIWRET